MDRIIEQAVERAIDRMRRGLNESLTVDDLACSAMFSKFHFSRMFLDVTGLTPGRFLSALRIAESKRLLEATAWTVADISCAVGYNSVGTFSMRFHSSVGVPPSTYRDLIGPGRGASRRDGEGRRQPTSRGVATVQGRLRSPDASTRVVVGVFGRRIIEGVPVCFSLADTNGSFRLVNVPIGAWWVLAQSVDGDADGRPSSGGVGPLELTSAEPVTADITLEQARPTDPPALLHMATLLSGEPGDLVSAQSN